MTRRRKFWLFMSSSSKAEDIERARQWYKGLKRLKSLEDPQSAEKEERAEKEAAEREQAEQDEQAAEEAYVDDDFDEHGSESASSKYCDLAGWHNHFLTLGIVEDEKASAVHGDSRPSRLIFLKGSFR